MPAVGFVLRWPDGVEQQCTSPSTVVHAHLAEGMAFGVAELVARTAAAMDAASDRVQQVYGMRCTAALHQQEEIARAAARYDGGTVEVVRVA
jgi:uncharacterized repeat protein (TIGR04042 family)